MEIKAASYLGQEKFKNLAGVYEDCFSEHPWYEVFRGAEARIYLEQLARGMENIGFVAFEGNLIAGAILAEPLSCKRDVCQFLPEKIYLEDAMYVAEVFVRKRFRRRGIAAELLKRCEDEIKEYQYTHIIQRTNFESKMFPLIEKSAYTLIDIQEVMSKKLMGRTIAEVPEKRGIFLKEL